MLVRSGLPRSPRRDVHAGRRLAGRFWPRTPARAEHHGREERVAGARGRQSDAPATDARPPSRAPALTFYQDLTAPLHRASRRRNARAKPDGAADKTRRSRRMSRRRSLSARLCPKPPPAASSPARASRSRWAPTGRVSRPRRCAARSVAAGHEAYVAESRRERQRALPRAGRFLRHARRRSG